MSPVLTSSERGERDETIVDPVVGMRRREGFIRSRSTEIGVQVGRSRRRKLYVCRVDELIVRDPHAPSLQSLSRILSE